jgi:hypothetical protein
VATKSSKKTRIAFRFGVPLENAVEDASKICCFGGNLRHKVDKKKKKKKKKEKKIGPDLVANEFKAAQIRSKVLPHEILQHRVHFSVGGVAIGFPARAASL